MSETITYKGYTGAFVYSERVGMFIGRALGVAPHVITFQGKDRESAMDDFCAAVDSTLEVDGQSEDL
jgi:predicted HicB family RNase H-like nuclease